VNAAELRDLARSFEQRARALAFRFPVDRDDFSSGAFYAFREAAHAVHFEASMLQYREDLAAATDCELELIQRGL